MIGSRAAAMLQRLLPYNDQLPWVAHAVGEAEKVIARNRPSVLLSTSPPVATHLAAWIVSRRYRIPWIADFRDPLYGNPSRSRKWGWIWDMPLERLLISDAAAVIANTDTAAEMLKQRYPVHRDKIHIIWNGYDPEEALSARPIPTRRYRLMVHAGSLYDQRHPSLLLATLDRLIARRALDSEKIRLRLIGEFYRNDPWVQQSKFEDLIRIGCVEHSHGAVPAAEAIREMTEADFLLLLDLHHRGRGIQVPAKIFEYIQIGRPILVYTNRNSPVERILANSGIRHVCIYPESSAEEMDAAVLRFLEAPSTADRASEWFRQQFDGRAQTGTLAAILNAVSV
jgi:glycosyltransferase involved in cell wall biosynthesis